MNTLLIILLLGLVLALWVYASAIRTQVENLIDANRVMDADISDVEGELHEAKTELADQRSELVALRRAIRTVADRQRFQEGVHDAA